MGISVILGSHSAMAQDAGAAKGVGFVFSRLFRFFTDVYTLLLDPRNMFLLFFCTLVGIFFGAMPGLTATLGVALLTTPDLRTSA